ncbi:MAG: hypothetical protein AAGM38_01050 [Pseudomonadota bacterium]
MSFDVFSDAAAQLSAIAASAGEREASEAIDGLIALLREARGSTEKRLDALEAHLSHLDTPPERERSLPEPLTRALRLATICAPSGNKNHKIVVALERLVEATLQYSKIAGTSPCEFAERLRGQGEAMQNDDLTIAVDEVESRAAAFLAAVRNDDALYAKEKQLIFARGAMKAADQTKLISLITNRPRAHLSSQKKRETALDSWWAAHQRRPLELRRKQEVLDRL